MSRRIFYSKDGTRCYSGTYEHTSAELSEGAKQVYDAEPYTRSGYYLQNAGVANPDFLIFNFPQPVQIDKVMWIYQYGYTFNMYVCIDGSTTDGTDGNWVWVGNITSVANSPVYSNVTPMSTRWFRVVANDYNHFTNIGYAWHLYGKYDAPRFTLWESDESAEILDNAWLDFPEAPNHLDYSETKSFVISNDDDISHDYRVTATHQDYSADATIVNYFFISEDDGLTKVKTFDILGVAPGTFSSIIYAHMDMLKLTENPGIGAHYPRIQIEEINVI